MRLLGTAFLINVHHCVAVTSLSLDIATNRRGSLKAFISELTGIEQGSIICFLSDGQQLRDENLRQLAGTPEDVSFWRCRSRLEEILDGR